MRVSENYVLKSPEIRLITYRKYREDNLEKEKARCLAYYYNNKAKMNEQRKLNYRKQRLRKLELQALNRSNLITI
jgi:hypothetical protein